MVIRGPYGIVLLTNGRLKIYKNQYGWSINKPRDCVKRKQF
jgi:hypothetical protein